MNEHKAVTQHREVAEELERQRLDAEENLPRRMQETREKLEAERREAQKLATT